MFSFEDKLRVLSVHATAERARLSTLANDWFIEFMYAGERTATLPFPREWGNKFELDMADAVEQITPLLRDAGFIYFPHETGWVKQLTLAMEVNEAKRLIAAVERLAQ